MQLKLQENFNLDADFKRNGTTDCPLSTTSDFLVICYQQE